MQTWGLQHLVPGRCPGYDFILSCVVSCINSVIKFYFALSNFITLSEKFSENERKKINNNRNIQHLISS